MYMCLLHVCMYVCVCGYIKCIYVCVGVYRLPTHSAQMHVCVFACRGQRLMLGTSLGHSPLYFFFQMRTLTEPVALNSVNDIRDPPVSVFFTTSVEGIADTLSCAQLLHGTGDPAPHACMVSILPMKLSAHPRNHIIQQSLVLNYVREYWGTVASTQGAIRVPVPLFTTMHPASLPAWNLSCSSHSPCGRGQEFLVSAAGRVSFTKDGTGSQQPHAEFSS